jgi:hypothetical protein
MSFEAVLQLTEKITLLPVVHGSGDFAVEVRRRLLEGNYDCIAVPLPPSLQPCVEEAVGVLPQPTMVVQYPSSFSWDGMSWDELTHEESGGWSEEDSRDEKAESWVNYVPVEPCQPVIAAIRFALEEHLPRAFVDLETDQFQPHTCVLPDPYALKRVPLERFVAAVVPVLQPPPSAQFRNRMGRMAFRLRQLEQRYRRIVMLCSLVEWPWLRMAYREAWDEAEDEVTGSAEIREPDEKTLFFMFGELPFVAALYERARAELEDDRNLSVDGLKELLLSARQAYTEEYGQRARTITPHLLALMLKYIRNLCLLERRFTPDLYTIVVAAQQVAGDAFALHVVETARQYAYLRPAGYPQITLGIGKGRLDDGRAVRLVSRLPGLPVVWRSCRLRRRPDKRDVRRWRMQWNPFEQCSYPPEDEAIENFRAHLFERAKAVIGADLVRTEKFTTSIKDGIDIRDTLRHWYTGDIYVKILPPNRGNLDCAVMVFEYPADPRDYPWRTTWYAEHEEESTLAFYATHFLDEIVGPGIAAATYGGALFLYPPIVIPNIWTDPRLDFAETLEDRLLAAACLHARSRQIVLLSPVPPGAGWRRLAKRFGKHLVHLPLSQFSQSTLEKLRRVHVLNGKHVRSYAAHFIRRP